MRTRNRTISFCFPSAAQRTASAIVRLLQIRTVVFAAPIQKIGIVAGRRERRRIPLPVHKVSQEQAAEEHDFGDQEDPHADRRGVLLLTPRLRNDARHGHAKQRLRLRRLRCDYPTCTTSSVVYVYASCVITGVTSKFSIGGGDAVCHSRPGEPHGFGGASGPYLSDQSRYKNGIR